MSQATVTVMPARPVTLPAPIPLLLCIVLLPPALTYIELASSMALGTMLSGTLAFALCLTKLPISPRRQQSAVQHLLLLVLGIALHLLLVMALGPVDLGRGLTSLLPLCLCVAGAWAFAELLYRANGAELARGLKLTLKLLGVIALLGALGWLQPSTVSYYGKPVFPFSEPSHLAMVSTPLLIYTCVSSRPAVRLLYLVAALLATALLQNLTMAAVCILTAVICLKPRYLLLLLLVLVPVLASQDLSYYADRLEFSEESQNLSALVYMQGWQLLLESWERSRGLGLGFQQLGVFGTNVPASALIDLLFGDSLNVLDGGFTLSKLLSEFGVIGVLLLLAYLACALRAVLLLRAVALRGQRHPTALVFAASCISGYVIELTLRGAGYFTPTGMLLIAALLLWHRHTTGTRRRARPRPISDGAGAA